MLKFRLSAFSGKTNDFRCNRNECLVDIQMREPLAGSAENPFKTKYCLIINCCKTNICNYLTDEDKNNKCY